MTTGFAGISGNLAIDLTRYHLPPLVSQPAPWAQADPEVTTPTPPSSRGTTVTRIERSMLTSIIPLFHLAVPRYRRMRSRPPRCGTEHSMTTLQPVPAFLAEMTVVRPPAEISAPHV